MNFWKGITSAMWPGWRKPVLRIVVFLLLLSVHLLIYDWKVAGYHIYAPLPYEWLIGALGLGALYGLLLRVLKDIFWASAMWLFLTVIPLEWHWMMMGQLPLLGASFLAMGWWWLFQHREDQRWYSILLSAMLLSFSLCWSPDLAAAALAPAVLWIIEEIGGDARRLPSSFFRSGMRGLYLLSWLMILAVAIYNHQLGYPLLWGKWHKVVPHTDSLLEVLGIGLVPMVVLCGGLLLSWRRASRPLLVLAATALAGCLPVLLAPGSWRAEDLPPLYAAEWMLCLLAFDAIRWQFPGVIAPRPIHHYKIGTALALLTLLLMVAYR